MKKRNKKVVWCSILALVFLILSFANWFFMIPAVILMIINQKELMG